jgi:hypothetical protein
MRVLHNKTRVMGFAFAVVFSTLLTHFSLTVGPQTASAGGAGTRVFLPVKMKSPAVAIVANSYYMHVSAPEFSPVSLGQSDAQEHQPVIESGKRLIFTLDWGQPCKTSSEVWGAYANDDLNTCHPMSELQTLIQNNLDSYCAKMQSIKPGGSGQNCGYRYNPQAAPLIIALGVNNCAGGQYCLNADTDPSNAVTYGHGQAWGAMVQNIATFALSRGFTYQVFIAGAMDIEGEWNTYVSTKSWLDGYKNKSSRNLYNYGNCDCPDGYQPFAPFHRDRDYNKIHEVASRGGSHLFYPLPEIYHTDGIDARRWQGVSKWAVINGYSKMTFRELLTQSGACAQGLNCPGTNNGPMDAIIQMRQALDADPRTTGGLIADVRSSDISWYPRP